MHTGGPIRSIGEPRCRRRLTHFTFAWRRVKLTQKVWKGGRRKNSKENKRDRKNKRAITIGGRWGGTGYKSFMYERTRLLELQVTLILKHCSWEGPNFYFTPPSPHRPILNGDIISMQEDKPAMKGTEQERERRNCSLSSTQWREQLKRTTTPFYFKRFLVLHSFFLTHKTHDTLKNFKSHIFSTEPKMLPKKEPEIDRCFGIWCEMDD